ncbi:stage II sporulation protein M [Archaeoglobus profundus]|nr:stage II sporulation protein M [Archaeoglobus profundus]
MKEFIVLLAVFLLSTYIGYQWAASHPDQAETFIKQIFESLSFVKDLPQAMIFAVIFVNNTVKSFVNMLLGLAFGVIPVLFIAINGFTIGVVSAVVSKNVGLLKVLLMLIPHGILEIPAVLIACSYGLKLGIATLNRARGVSVDIKFEIKRAVRAYLKYVMPMLLVAAFIETYVTPIISQI